MGKMEKFYEGWVRMTAHPMDNLGVTKDIWYFDRGDKQSRFEVRNFVHRNLRAGLVVVTTPWNKPTHEELVDAYNRDLILEVGGEKIFNKEHAVPCKVVLKFTWEHHHGAILIKNPAAGQSVLLQGDDATSFLREIGEAETFASDHLEYDQMIQELLHRYQELMEDDE